MSRLQKLKIENIKKANELLENGHNKQYPPQVVILKPGENVTNSSNSFVNKMSNLKEEVIKEEPERGTNYMITKAERQILINLGGKAKEVGDAADENFQKYCK